MKNFGRSLGLIAIFLAGCATANAVALFMVPPVRAGTNPPRWEYRCVTYGELGGIGFGQRDTMAKKMNEFGAEGWEIALSDANMGVCFKRPL